MRGLQAGGTDISASAFKVLWWNCTTRCDFVGYIKGPLADRILGRYTDRTAICVTGLSWIQPTANMNPRAEFAQSAPIERARAMSKAVTSLPLAPRHTCSAQASSAQGIVNKDKAFIEWHAHMIGKFKRCGPVPPSLPSTTMKSGHIPVSQHRLDDAHKFPPMTDAQLEANRLPPLSWRKLAINSIISIGVPKAL